VGNGSVDDPDRTITGRAQLDWLKAGLKASDTAWRLVGNSVMISPFVIGSLTADLFKPLAELLGLVQELQAKGHIPPDVKPAAEPISHRDLKADRP
jgi:alkaline phosphatase D